MKKRSHGEGSVTQRKDGSWTARIQIGFNGKPKIKAFYGKTRKEVADKLYFLTNVDTLYILK